ncbi:MAG: hypothetical protein Q9183_002840 [Haloplaca sp. 2 TL-2023]
MASLIFQKAGWSLQVSRTSKSFAVTFTTALPRRARPQGITPNVSNNSKSSRANPLQRHPEHSDLRSNSTFARCFQAQQARAATTATAPTESASQPPPASDRHQRAADEAISTEDLAAGLSDKPVELDEGSRQVDWARSFHGLSTEAFSKEAANALLAPIEQDDIEVKPDGIVYLPEIKYRRILNKAFGPGGWGLAPRGETIVTAKAVTREYALVALGRFVSASSFVLRFLEYANTFSNRLVSVARGEQDYFSPEGIPTAVEGCKSNALMRCCKDLGVASELWDPRFIRKFIAGYAKEVWVEHQQTQKRRKIWMRKDDQIRYPFKLYSPPSQSAPRSNNSKY